MRLPLSYALAFSSLLLLLLAVEGKGPYLILGNSRPKCITVQAPRGTTLTVEYDVPDMVEITEDGPVFDKKKDGEEALGMDTQYERRFMDKFNAMKRAGRTMRDMSIVVMQKGETVRDAREIHKQRNRMDMMSLPGGRLRKELEEKQGVIEYTTGSKDGPVEVCAQSLMASPQNPSRVSLFVNEKVVGPKRESASKDSSLDESQRKAKEHMSRMERDIIGLTKRADTLLSNADYAKEQEVQFHDQSLAMNKASQWWPMIHVLVLFITGFTQANHIVRFFKQRHIF